MTTDVALPENLKVMVIDDSKTIRRTAESILVGAGAQVVTASDGFEALARVAEHNPDIIFVDVMMPRLDGYQVCALVKHNVNYRHIPVVVLSSKDSIFDKARGRLVGADSYLTKPFQREDLLVTIRKHLVQRTAPASA